MLQVSDMDMAPTDHREPTATERGRATPLFSLSSFPRSGQTSHGAWAWAGRLDQNRAAKSNKDEKRKVKKETLENPDPKGRQTANNGDLAY